MKLFISAYLGYQHTQTQLLLGSPALTLTRVAVSNSDEKIAASTTQHFEFPLQFCSAKPKQYLIILVKLADTGKFLHWLAQLCRDIATSCKKTLKFKKPNLHTMLVQPLNPLTAKLFNLNFHPLEVVSRWRDPQLQVSENYSDLTKWRSTVFKYCWLMSHFIFNMFKRW